MLLCIEMKLKPDTKTERDNPLYGKFDQAVKALVTPKPEQASRRLVGVRRLTAEFRDRGVREWCASSPQCFSVGRGELRTRDSLRISSRSLPVVVQIFHLGDHVGFNCAHIVLTPHRAASRTALQRPSALRPQVTLQSMGQLHSSRGPEFTVAQETL